MEIKKWFFDAVRHSNVILLVGLTAHGWLTDVTKEKERWTKELKFLEEILENEILMYTLLPSEGIQTTFLVPDHLSKELFALMLNIRDVEKTMKDVKRWFSIINKDKDLSLIMIKIIDSKIKRHLEIAKKWEVIRDSITTPQKT